VSVPGCALPIGDVRERDAAEVRQGNREAAAANEQSDGASAIHSADVVSTSWSVVSTFENRVWRVRF
jgi:hypothetical protein